MGHYAKIDENNIVTEVIVAKREFIESGAVGDPSKWIKTSYHTRNGKHELGGTSIRKNFAEIGSMYHPEGDFFSPPKPFPSFILDEETGQWKAPVPCPDTPGTENQYNWDEQSKSWIDITKKQQ